MIVFITNHIINRTKALNYIYEELAKRIESNNLKIINIAAEKIENISKQINTAELIVIDTSLLLSMGDVSHIKRNLYIGKRKSKNFYFDIWNLVDRSDIPVFLLHPSSDLHSVNFGLKRDFYLSLLKRISGIFWPYHQCPFDRNNENERYPFNILKPYNLTKKDLINIWDEIKETVPISIDFARCVSEKEMKKRANNKFWDIIIPGMTYETRDIALKKAVEAGLKVAPYINFSKWVILAPYLVADKIMPDKYSTLFYQKHSYNIYKFMISHSAVSFACGSELRYFVRKFLEIPAYRTAMIAYPPLNFLDYGFEDGVHYLHSFPEEVGEKTKFLLKHKNIADKLVQNAWDLVFREHTAKVKVDQILACLDFFKKGKLKSAGYVQGNFEIIS